MIDRAKIATKIGFFLRFFEKNPVVIVRIDGGFSSQLLRYAVGWQLKEQGYRVEYDLSFYEDDGKSIDGKDDRLFRLKECFPYLEIPEADRNRIEKYRKFYDCDLSGNVDMFLLGERIREPFYISGNTRMTQIVTDYRRIFDFSGIIDLMSENARKLFDEMTEIKKKKKLVGVHVRRGDMTLTGHHWKVLTADYYIKIIDRIKSDDMVVCFFSEDFDWVKNNILPKIAAEFILADQNNEEYVDFFLYSLCSTLVASQSSWGRRAMYFNDNPDRKLILPEKKGESISSLEKIYGKGRVEIEKLDFDMFLSDC